MQKKIELVKLELTNYRNIERAVLEFDGNSKIIGENRIGKTNTLESIYFLITNYLLDGSSDLSAIKPLNDTKKVVRVQGTFRIDGNLVSIAKEYGENWVKTRGTTELVLKGHFTDFYYQGVKQGTLKEYNSLVEKDFGVSPETAKINMIQLLINPYYLGNLGDSKDWTNLRTFIIDLVGDVNDEDIFNEVPATRMIAEDLNRVSGRIDQLKKQYSNDIKSIEEQILSDNGKIEAYENTENPTDESVAIAQKGIEEHETRLAQLRSNKGIDTKSAAIVEKINAKKSEINDLREEELKNNHSKELLSKSDEINKEVDNLYQEIYELAKKKASLTEEHTRIVNLREDLLKNIDQLKNHRLELIQELKNIDIMILNPQEYVEDECPHCHRKYDETNLDDAIKHLIESLHNDKNNDIAKGKAIKSQIEEIESKLVECGDELKELNNKIFDIDHEITEKRDTIRKLQQEKSQIVIPSNQPSDKMLTLMEELDKLNEDLRKSQNEYQLGINNVQQEIYDEQQAEEPFKKILVDREYYNRQQEQLKKAVDEKNSHERKLSEIQQKKELINAFIRCKLEMLDRNVSKVFGNIKFKLIDENLNGGFDPICKPYIFDTLNNRSTNVLWKSGSKSERVITGIAICECVKAKLGLPDMPFLFDEGGEISTDTFNTRFNTESQIICVKVQDGIDKPTVVRI